MTQTLCVIREEPEFLSDIRDFITLWYVILRAQVLRMVRVVYRETDSGMRFAIQRIDLAIRDFAFFQHCF